MMEAKTRHKPDDEQPFEEKEYTYEEFLKRFAPDADREGREERDSASQIGQDIAGRVIRQLRENLAK
jgi:hypothetical protein